jgi:hypothetical protein
MALRDGTLIRFAQERFHRIEIFPVAKHYNVSDVSAVRDSLCEQRVLRLARQMDCKPERIKLYNQVGKDAIAAKQDISRTRHEFHWPKRFDVCLQRSIQFNDSGRPVAQNVRALTGTAGMPLVDPNEAALALGTCPQRFH